MYKEKVEDVLFRIIRVLIFATLLTPLILGPFGINFVEYPKAIFFKIIIEIIFAFYIALIIFNKSYLPKKSILLWSILFFDVVMFIASLFGINFFRSFFGDMPRGEGFIMHLHLLAFFIVITGIFREKEDWFNLLKFSAIIGGLSSLAALIQQSKIASLYGMYLPRLSGTMSNPDLFGTYIVLCIFVTIFILAIEKSRNLKIVWFLLILLNCYTLFFSGTRGSWIGIAVGLITIVIFNFYRLNKKNKIIISGILLVAFICALIFFVNLNWFKHSSFGLISRAADISNLNGRTDVWKAAINAIKDRPILGWGFESFTFVSDKYMTGLGNGIYYDRVHNKILEVLVYGGIAGILAYFLIFIAIFYFIFKHSDGWNNYNNRPKIVYISILVAFFVASVAQNIFAFDNIGTYILFFLVAGFINNNFPLETKITNEEEKFDDENSKLKLYFKIIVIIVTFIIIGWVSYQVNLKPTIAAMNFPNSMFYEKDDVGRALSGYEQGISIHTIYDTDLRLTFADKMFYLLNSQAPDSIKEKAYNDLIKIKPFFYESIAKNDEQINHAYQFLIKIDEEKYEIYKDQSGLDDMQKDIEKAISFNPKVGAYWQLKGEMEILKNNDSQGELDIKKGCDLSNLDEAAQYKEIGGTYLTKGDMKSALYNLEKVIDINYANKKKNQETVNVSINNAKFIDYVASLYCKQLKDINNCQRLYNKGADIYPEYAPVFKQHFEILTSQNNKK